MLNLPTWTYMLPVALINVCASLLLKLGAGDPPVTLLLGFLSWRSFLGLACFGLGGLAYAYLLRYVPLHIAQTILSSQYVLTVLGACFLLHEQVSFTQICGFLLVGVGIALIIVH